MIASEPSKSSPILERLRAWSDFRRFNEHGCPVNMSKNSSLFSLF